jgi:pimeloyl-ACP methyl ester carboxylesterase
MAIENFNSPQALSRRLSYRSRKQQDDFRAFHSKICESGHFACFSGRGRQVWAPVKVGIADQHRRFMRRFLFLFCFFAIGPAASAEPSPQWLTLPPTPTLPQAAKSGYAPLNDVKIWYAEYGRGEPVILLHGGLANANYWGNQVPELAKSYRVIVMDSRGHGRSTRDNRPFGYGLMASDVIALMDYLEVSKAAIVGWSDGAILGLDIAIHHPERITKLFAFAANSDPSAVKDVTQSPVFNKFIARAKAEYEQLSSTPDAYKSFLDQITGMWAAEPNFTAEQLRAISVPVLIADGDHDEAIKRENAEFMAKEIPNAGFLLQPGVSHFAFLQDPEKFNCDLLHFLQHVR